MFIKVSVYDTNAWESAQWSEQNGWCGPSLLQLAGIYNKWNSSDGDVYSYSIITMESSKSFSQLHHRIPAVLENEQLIEVNINLCKSYLNVYLIRDFTFFNFFKLILTT
jgi:hypothetical protein